MSNSHARSSHVYNSVKGIQGKWRRLERRRWWSWWLLAGSSLVTVAGLSASIQTLIPERIQQLWPWAATEDVLLVGVSVLLACFIVYLTLVQRATRIRIEELAAEIEDQSERHYRRLVTLLEVSHMVGHHSDLQLVFDGITSSCTVAFDAQWASLMLYEPDLLRLVVASCSGDINDDIVGSSQNLGEGVAGWVAKHRRPLVLGPNANESAYPELTFSHPFVGRSMVVPIIVDMDLLGIISVASMEADAEYTEQDLQTLLVFAENIGISIRHAQELRWITDGVDEPAGETAQS